MVKSILLVYLFVLALSAPYGKGKVYSEYKGVSNNDVMSQRK